MRSDHFLGTRPRIGRVELPPTLLAPMSGVTDVAFRRIAARFGAGLVVTEMVAAGPFVDRAREASLRAAGEGIFPHVVQLVGRDPATMADAARLAEAGGADIVDINFGCPAKKVVGGLGGSVLMREPALARAIVEAVASAVRVPVTVKMRLGWDADHLNALDISRDALSAGAQAICVHGRTRQQFYAGTADWDAIGAVVSDLPCPVVANGDVVDLGTARACLARSGAAAVMIGRAALGRPWIVGSIGRALAGRGLDEPSPAEKTAAAIDHYEALLTLYGRDLGLRHARKHLAAYADRAAEEGEGGLDPAERSLLVTTAEPALVVRLLGRLRAGPTARAA